MLAGAVLVWIAVVVGLRLLSGGGAWQMGWLGAMGWGTVLWPPIAAGYGCLSRLFGSPAERTDELYAWSAKSFGVASLVVSVCWSSLVLGFASFLQAFSDQPRGGFANFMMSVLALHLVSWGGAGVVQWALSVRRAREQ